MKVFISSTTAGLGSYRAFAAELLSVWHGVDPVWQETLTANDQSAVGYLSDKIGGCDRVICLIGPYLGTCPPNQPPTQRRSYCQMEYDKAKQDGKPIHIFDGRECQLDNVSQPESAPDRQLQEAFWKELEQSEGPLRPAFRDHAELSKLLLRLIQEWEAGSDSVRNLPTPLNLLCRRLNHKILMLDSLGSALSFVGCLAAAEVARSEPLPVSKLKLLQSAASGSKFVAKLAYADFVDLVKWYEDARQREVPHEHAEIEKRFETAIRLLRVLESYLLVRVEHNSGMLSLRVYRGHSPERKNNLQPCEDFNAMSCHGNVYLLDVRRKKAMCLSPQLQSLPKDPDTLCAWVGEPSATTTFLRPLVSGMDPVPAPTPRPEAPSESALLASHSWTVLAKAYERQLSEYCGGWRTVGAVAETRNRVERFLVVHDAPAALPAGLWRAKDDAGETARKRICQVFGHWSACSKTDSQLISRVHHFESGDRPAIVATIPAGMSRLSRFLLPGAPRLDLGTEPLRQLIFGTVELCRFLASQGLRLIHVSPSDLYWDGKQRSQLTGFGGILADGECLPHDGALWDVLSGDERPIVAPELTEEEAGATIASEMFAVGVLLQRCRHEPIYPRPQGDQDDVQDNNMFDDWRVSPLECLVFHCLARNPNRRFITWDQFQHYFDVCTAPDAEAQLTKPTMVQLANGLWISRCPISNYQYERFCDEQRQDVPAQSLAWNYSTPFGPVVGISIADCEGYCEWLGERYGGRWRLPTVAEWTDAAGTGPFPWGDTAPSPALANYWGGCRGPTVVGAYPTSHSEMELRDMAGNVWEWCWDRAPDGPWRLLKGGSFSSPKHDLQIRSEDRRIAGGRYLDVGFRVVQEGAN
jgi:hypothetical protein